MRINSFIAPTFWHFMTLICYSVIVFKFFQLSIILHYFNPGTPAGTFYCPMHEEKAAESALELFFIKFSSISWMERGVAL